MAMIDSGCAPNLINDKIVGRFRKCETTPLRPCQVGLVGAGGAQIAIAGSISVVVQIDGFCLDIDCIVCMDLEEDAILGFGFLEVIQATLDARQLKLITPQLTMTLVKSNQHLSAALAVTRTGQTIPANTSAVLDVRLSDTSSFTGVATVVLKCVHEGLRCTSSIKSMEFSRPQVEVLNDTDSDVKLKQGDAVAEVLPVIGVKAILSKQKDRPDPWNAERVKEIMKNISIGDDDSDHSWVTKFRDVTIKYIDVFCLNEEDMVETPHFSFDIKLLSDIPISVRPFPQPIHLREQINTEIDRLLARNIIEPSTSLWNSRVFFVKKPNKQELRTIVDYRRLNSVIESVPCIVPVIREAVTFWHGCTFFIVADLTSSFYQLGINESSRCVTAWEVVGKGKFQWKKVPLGLSQSPGNLMQVMLKVIDGLQPYVLVYIDDLIIAASDEGHLLQLWEEILRRLQKFRLSLRPDKTRLLKKRIFALGHYISAANGLEPNRSKIASLLDMAYPKSLKQAKSFLGAVNYFEMFISSVQNTARGLINDTKVKTRSAFKLSEEGKRSFDNLKIALAEATNLGFPDPGGVMILQVDSSAHCYASALIQIRDGKPMPLGFNSKLIPAHELKLHINIKEFISLHYAVVKRWSQYLKATPFIIETDNMTILGRNFLRNNDSAKMQRMLADLSLFSFTMRHIQSSKNFIADSLTRFDTIEGSAPMTWPPAASTTDNCQTAITEHKDGIPSTKEEGHMAATNATADSEVTSIHAAMVADDDDDDQEDEGDDDQEDDGADDQEDDGADDQEDDGADDQEGDGADDQESDGADDQEGDGADDQEGEGADDKPDNDADDQEDDGADDKPDDGTDDKPDDDDQPDRDNDGLGTENACNKREAGPTIRMETICTVSATQQPDSGSRVTSNPHLTSHATSAEIAKMQDEDYTLSYVKERVREGMTADARDRTMSSDQWYHLKAHGMYSIDQTGCLLREYIENFTGISRLLIVVPDALQAPLVKEAHDGATSGHFGVERTLSLLRKAYYFKEMRKQVRLYIATCAACVRVEHEYAKKPRAPLQPFAAKAVGSDISIDCAGPFSRTSAGNFRYYVLICCSFSGFCQARALRSLSASAVVDILIQQWYPLMGLSETILSDNGSEFRAKIVDELCKVLGIKHKFTSIYSPRTNGRTERMNSSLKRAIKKIVMGSPRDWHKYLNMCCLAYNTSTSSKTHMTPFFTVTGREARLPIQCIRGVVFTEPYETKADVTMTTTFTIKSGKSGK